MSVRVRFAPSPTGYLHVGGARTALYNYLFARHHQGQFILRIEDTDEARSTEESLRMQIADLQWLGLKWNEGPDPETLQDRGSFGPYRQSQRLTIYQEYAQKLLAQGQAYYCFLTDAEIEAQRQKAKDENRPPQVDSPYRDLSLEAAQAKIQAGESAVVRFKTGAKRDYKFVDLVRGEVTFPSDMVGDFVLLRSSGMPVYNFCCAVDDALMKITHVFRAEEHLSNTLRQMMIYEALGFDLPQFGHLSIILGPDKQKLSKRHGATSCKEYAERGYLPEALNNFLALLGWSSPMGQEILSIKDLVAQFNPERLHSAAAVFDEQKLKWMNATHLRALDHKELWKNLEPFFKEAGLSFQEDPEWQDRAVSVFKTSMETLRDAIELFRPLAQGPLDITDEGKDALSWDTSRSVVEKWQELVASQKQDYMTEEQFLQLQDRIKEECQVKGKQLFMPIRVAIIGKPHGAELKTLVPLLDKQSLLARAQAALNHC